MLRAARQGCSCLRLTNSLSVIALGTEQAKAGAVSAGLPAGFQAGAKAFLASSLAVGSAHTFWPAFRRGLGPSGKMALVVSPVMFAFLLNFEHGVSRKAKSAYRKEHR